MCSASSSSRQMCKFRPLSGIWQRRRHLSSYNCSNAPSQRPTHKQQASPLLHTPSAAAATFLCTTSCCAMSSHLWLRSCKKMWTRREQQEGQEEIGERAIAASPWDCHGHLHCFAKRRCHLPCLSTPQASPFPKLSTHPAPTHSMRHTCSHLDLREIGEPVLQRLHHLNADLVDHVQCSSLKHVQVHTRPNHLGFGVGSLDSCRAGRRHHVDARQLLPQHLAYDSGGV